MIMTENELIRTLAEHAEHAPSADGLLLAVHRRSRAHARRRNAAGAIATAAVAAFAFAAAGVAGPAGLQRQDEIVLDWQNAAQSDFLVPVDLRPSFPLTPAELPPGVVTTPRLMVERGVQHAEWGRAQSGTDGAVSGVAVTVFSSEPDGDGRAVGEPVAVQGTTGQLVRSEGVTVLTWRHRSGQWVSVSGYTPVSEAETVSFARSLHDETFTQQAGFDIDVAPERYVLAELRSAGLTLGPADGIPNAQDDPRAVTVSVRRASGDTDGNGVPVRIGDRSGWLNERPGRYDLVLRLGDSTRLEISTPAGGEWDRNALAELADGIDYTGSAPRAEG
jgi:hypothetical protein